MKQPEKAFEKKLMKALREKGITVFKMNTDYPGFPDLLCFLKWKYCLLELKVIKSEKQNIGTVMRKEQFAFYQEHNNLVILYIFKCRNKYVIGKHINMLKDLGIAILEKRYYFPCYDFEGLVNAISEYF